MAVPDGTELVILVVENDREQFCKEVVAAVEKQSAIAIEYHNEPHIGISAARNAVLDVAMANGSDYLAFIDDDELAHSRWIKRLFAAMVEYGAMIAGGPVNRTFQCKEVPAWAKRYFRPIQSSQGGWPNVIPGVLPTGTGNMLIDLAPVCESGIRFDMNYNLTGAEDHVFIEAFAKACNGNAVYVNDANVCEVIPASRLTRSYIFRRILRDHSHIVRRQNGSCPGFGFAVGQAISGVSHIAVGGLFCALTCFVNSTMSTIFLMKMAKGCGILLGLAGHHPSTYKKITGC